MITQRHPDTAVVVLTMLQDDGSMLAAVRAGARGYLLKGADEAGIATTLRVVAAGGAVFGPDVAARALAGVRAGPPTVSGPFPDPRDRRSRPRPVQCHDRRRTAPEPPDRAQLRLAIFAKLGASVAPTPSFEPAPPASSATTPADCRRSPRWQPRLPTLPRTSASTRSMSSGLVWQTLKAAFPRR